MALPLKEKKSLHFFFILILIQLILLSIQVPRAEDVTLMKRAFLAIFTPVQAGLSWIGQTIGEFWNEYLFWRNLQGQNKKLKEEVFYLRQENIILENLLRRFSEETEIRKRLDQLSSPTIVAGVIGVDAGNIFKSLIINRGEHHKIKANMIVLDPKGNLLGRIINPVLEWTSRVQLITDETSGVGVVTAGRGVSGVLRGDGRGRCHLDYVLISAPEISLGEEVVTSGFDGVYPAGFPVGRVISVSTEGTFFKKILVEPYFRLNGLSQVAVISFDIKNL